MSKDIKHLVNSCVQCQTHQPTQRKQPLITSGLPEAPLKRTTADFRTSKGQNYLVVTDYYLRYLEIIHLTSTTSYADVRKFRNLFARWRIPDECVSDNGPQFCSGELAKFSRVWFLSHYVEPISITQ